MKIGTEQFNITTELPKLHADGTADVDAVETAVNEHNEKFNSLVTDLQINQDDLSRSWHLLDVKIFNYGENLVTIATFTIWGDNDT